MLPRYNYYLSNKLQRKNTRYFKGRILRLGKQLVDKMSAAQILRISAQIPRIHERQAQAYL